LTHAEKVEKQTKALMDEGVDEATARQTAEWMVTTEDAIGSDVVKQTAPVLPPTGTRWGAPSIRATTPTNPGSLSHRRRGRGPY
jgi:hypothetical protein